VSETSDPHLPDSVLAAYLDRALSATARAAADAHLTECAACRDDLVALAALARSTRRPKALRVGGPIVAIAAAVVLLVLGPWRARHESTGVDGERLRETTAVTGARLRAIAPVDGVLLQPDSVRFTWQREAGDAGYHLTLTDEGGSVQWALDTSDTTVALPDSVRLQRGRTFYWYVDALSADGRTRATGLQRFRVAP
jgi:hypothetical protein